MRDPLEILRTTFGFSGFRGVQADVVDRVLAGQHTLAVMPTGAGKSLTYQLPSQLLEGTCLVISPLIALMHDQLRAAEAVGIRAATLTSVDSNRDETIERFRGGALDLLYVAPERASGEGFRTLLSQAPLALFAIDEAHCVSEWGHDFRPDYRLLRPLLDRFPDVPRLALTATADAHTRADICEQLGIPRDGMIVAGFDRPNIRYAISPRDQTTRQIADLMADQPGPGIVYAQTRAATEKLAEALGRTGRPTRAYHAGLDPAVRARNQADFVASEDMVICATVAFGMGIDKPDVRFVAHAGLPKSIEAYYQETGRAGRDGDPAVAHLFWGADDFARARQRIAEVEPARQPGERTRLTALAALVETAGCRRAILLRHFGEDPPEACGNCDNCLNAPAAVDATVVAQKYLSAVFRTGQMFGAGYVEAVLTGQSSERSLMNGHETLSVWNIAEDEEAALIKPVGRALLLRDALRANAHGGLEFGPGARGLLKGGETLRLVVPPKRERRRRGGGNAALNPNGDPLFEALRNKRRELAQDGNVPPYVIFHDSVLRDMAALRPDSRQALGAITGVGTRKLEAYGDAFLAVIAQAG
ncbi:RecQ family ATP-dependent DNA helicase [Sphingomonas japonica]|uniref:ATP-dependent DNA helicase RecQ n=1 Tax=Sphingomonas japonica TaxID=511662 RepID=A0ABX0U2B7_9SPHN|nr:ATP-dependent DNA helicase RecQ [Sphingomonas japonica]NIJ23512.1 ATP-dependent DNA helicase RecQ [Sphingomonas japonica]